jgi:MmyB-like transcription regulator ligand binding domain
MFVMNRSAEEIAVHLRSRSANSPGDPDVVALIAELLDDSPEFARLWQRPVAQTSILELPHLEDDLVYLPI